LTYNSDNSVRIALFGALFAALTAVGALIRIPVPPVPFTLQTFFVFLSGGLLGPKTGFLSQCIYLTIGLIGLPVFSGGGGPGYVFQPQFGYLLGMPAAAFAVGVLTDRFVWRTGTDSGKRISDMKRVALIYGAGTIIIYLFGLTYLSYYTAVIIGRRLDLHSIIWAGCIIFLPTDCIKIAAGSWLTVKLHRTGIIR